MLVDNCRKCGKKTFVFLHHILPQNLFGKNTETVPLCGDCHTKYHQHLGQKNLKNPDIKFHYQTFLKWLYLGVIIGILALIIF
jgi:hypothetical protein